MNFSTDLQVKLFCDAADIESLLTMYSKPYIKGFTTNPTLMHKAGVKDFSAFAHAVLTAIPDLPVSFEVFADDEAGMERQARLIASWGRNVYVKIPVTNTQGFSTMPLVRRLSRDGIALNVTALMTLEQVGRVAAALDPNARAIVSVFAGRIADTGVDPVPLMRRAVEILEERPLAELLWASSRELLNVFHAEESGTHIITATPEILSKLALVGKDLTAFSLETVRMLYKDAMLAGYALNDRPAGRALPAIRRPMPQPGLAS
ncbi:transaldolase [Acidipila sp. EB88]|uniref:transaldolase n=1 Tax=Acidipila sp. EB88 TaxID=2305226 RepID=UPI000F5FECFF|nr:transaldolase [Acidipila sp. EB88]RRA49528.1 transaldolase [Acidipila sp. EB88]